VVKAHFQAVHGKFSGSGFKTITVAVPGCPLQKFKICVGNRPGDIQAWIAERKKRFPRQSTSINNQGEGSANKKTEEEATTKEPGVLSSLLAGYGSSSSEDEDETKGQNESAKRQENLTSESNNVKKGITTAKMEEESKSTVAATIDQVDSEAKPKGVCHAFVKFGKCRRGASCPYLHDEKQRVAQVQQQEKQQQQSQGASSRTSKKTLLRKLLGKEMERETALTLSLLKYIVKSNFLSNGQGNDQAAMENDAES